MYDAFLRFNQHPGSKIIGFADNIPVLVGSKFLLQAEITCNQAVSMVKEWLHKNGLTLADHKTEAVVISSRKKVESADIMVGYHAMESKPFIKYLQVIIDHRLNFKKTAIIREQQSSRGSNGANAHNDEHQTSEARPLETS